MATNQILHQAGRKAKSNYKLKMKDPYGYGILRLRIDSAQQAARLGWCWYLRQHGLSPEVYDMPEWNGFAAGYC